MQEENLKNNEGEEIFLEEAISDEVIDEPEDTPVEGEVEESLAMLHALELERNGEADVYEFFINEDEEMDGEY